MKNWKNKKHLNWTSGTTILPSFSLRFISFHCNWTFTHDEHIPLFVFRSEEMFSTWILRINSFHGYTKRHGTEKPLGIWKHSDDWVFVPFFPEIWQRQEFEDLFKDVVKFRMNKQIVKEMLFFQIFLSKVINIVI